MCGKFATQALFSVHVMALGSTNREVTMTAGEVLFLETKLLTAVSSALLAIVWPPRKQTNNQALAFVFEPAFLPLNTTKAQTKFRKPQYLRAGSIDRRNLTFFRLSHPGFFELWSEIWQGYSSLQYHQTTRWSFCIHFIFGREVQFTFFKRFSPTLTPTDAQTKKKRKRSPGRLLVL